MNLDEAELEQLSWLSISFEQVNGSNWHERDRVIDCNQLFNAVKSAHFQQGTVKRTIQNKVKPSSYFVKFDSVVSAGKAKKTLNGLFLMKGHAKVYASFVCSDSLKSHLMQTCSQRIQEIKSAKNGPTLAAF